MKRTLATMATAAIASTVLLMPAAAHAEDPDVPGPDVDPCGIVWREAEIAYWKAAAAEARTDATAREVAAVNRALAAEASVQAYVVQLGARTVERNRLLVSNNRLRARANRLAAKVAELRERLRQEPRS